MPVPPQCQEFADEIDELEGQIQEVGELPGAEKAAAIARNIQIRHQITALQAKLNACTTAFGGGYVTDVVVLDVSPGGGTVTFPLEATLWDAGGAIEQRPVQGGRLSFLHDPPPPPDSPFSVSVDESANATFTGPLFRSNPFPTLPLGGPGNATGTITIVIPGPVPISAATLAGAMPLAMIPPIPGFTPTAATIAPGAGVITVTISGLLGAWPASYAYTFGLAPSRSMTAPATTVVDVVPTPGILSLGVIPGVPGTPSSVFNRMLLRILVSIAEPIIRAAVTPLVSTAINGAIVAGAVAFLGRRLTPFETISMRRIVVTPSGVMLFPTLCTYGP